MRINEGLGEQSYALLCDKFIGSGMSRDTYSSLLLPDCVVKVEDCARIFQNVLEWEIWQEVKNTKYSKWFAPCEFISPNGSILIQKKTEPMPLKKLPEKMPSFFCDFKKGNYGWFENRVVCHDYGLAYILNKGLNNRLKKVEWWE